jgi:hypothetical protein
MLKKEVIQIKAIKTGMEGDLFVIGIKVRNPEKRTLYAYGSPRRILYDNATGTLTLYLHDHHLSKEEEELLSPHLRQPRFVPLEAGTETEIKIKLEPVLNRIRSAVERGTGPLFEELRISEAKEVKVEIAHQDTPFYYNPKMDNAKQLKEWGQKITKASFKVTPLKPESNYDAEA